MCDMVERPTCETQRCNGARLRALWVCPKCGHTYSSDSEELPEVCASCRYWEGSWLGAQCGLRAAQCHTGPTTTCPRWDDGVGNLDKE